MTIEEARGRTGQSVLYSDGNAAAEEAVIVDVLRSYIFVRCRRGDRFTAARPEDLALPSHGVAAREALADGDLTASQARLNELAAEIIRGAAGDRWQIKTALTALREHNWAAGFPFEGASAADDGRPPGQHGERAVHATRALESVKKWAATMASWQARKLERAAPYEAAALLRRLKADAPALVYVVTHAALGAAKIGVSDAAGSRITEHRRAGWQLLAAFQVAADAACAIEDDVLKWWRHNLRLPPYLRRDQMPQGGWTETVAAGSIDLAATVAHVCEMALSPEAKPAAS